MRDPFFLIVILLALAVLAIREAYMNTNELDAVWSRLAQRRRARGMPAERTPEWDAAAPQRAIVYYIIAAAAVVGLVLMMAQLNSVPASGPDQVTYTVNGRPATPEEQQGLESAIRQQNHQTPSSQ